DRSGGPLTEASDCGDGAGVTLPKVECSGISTDPGGENGGGNGGPGGNGTPGAEEIPFVGACLCRTTGHAWRLQPTGVALAVGLPWILYWRRRRRQTG